MIPLLNKNIHVNVKIEKLLKSEGVNKNRLNSVAQKLRKKSLSQLLDNNYQINESYIKSFCKLLNLNDISFIEYLNYNLLRLLAFHNL